MSVMTGPAMWGQDNPGYPAAVDRQVITALARNQAGIVIPAVFTPHPEGLGITIEPGWLAVAPCGDGTHMVIGSAGEPGYIEAAPGGAAARTDVIWADLEPDAGQYAVSVVAAGDLDGRAGIQLATVEVPPGAADAAELAITPDLPPASGGGLAAVTVGGTAPAPLLEDGHIYDVTSAALAALTFAIPASVSPGYHAALTFRTQVDTLPLKFSQPESLWLEGRDCTGGILLPRAKTHYRIDFEYIRPRVMAGTGTSRPDFLVRGVVTGAWFGGEFTAHTNSQAAVDEVISRARAWRDSDQPSRPTVYGQATVLAEDWDGSPEIDCSTFAALVYRGVTLENSRYTTHSTSSNLGPVAWANELPRTAAEQARWCVAQGWAYDPGAHYEAIRGGDIVFFAQGAAASHSSWGTRYGHISHVAIADDGLEYAPDLEWEAGTISVSTGMDLGSAANRARMTAVLPLPVRPWPDEGLLLALNWPYIFISTHFYSWPDGSRWISGNGGLGYGYMGRRWRAWSPVPRGAAYFRCAVGKRAGGSGYDDMDAADYAAVRLSYGRTAIWEVTTGSDPKAPFFHRGMSPRNYAGLRVCARPVLDGGGQQ